MFVPVLSPARRAHLVTDASRAQGCRRNAVVTDREFEASLIGVAALVVAAAAVMALAWLGWGAS